MAFDFNASPDGRHVACGGVMVTTRQMREFALECLRWSDETDNASQREIMIGLAKTWMRTASQIDRRIMAGFELALPDLRSKLD